MLPVLLLSSAHATPLAEATPAPGEDTAQIEASIMRAQLYTASGVAIGTLGVGTTILGAAMFAEGLNDGGDYGGLGMVTGVFIGGVGVSGMVTGVKLIRAGVEQKRAGEQALRGASLRLTPTPSGLVLTGRF